MSKPKIQFLTFEGCPLADAARELLEDALGIVGHGEYDEIDILDPETPEEMRDWGSPTILVNGQDVAGGSKGNGVRCRVYAGPDKVPNVRIIVDRIRQERSR